MLPRTGWMGNRTLIDFPGVQRSVTLSRARGREPKPTFYESIREDHRACPNRLGLIGYGAWG